MRAPLVFCVKMKSMSAAINFHGNKSCVQWNGSDALLFVMVAVMVTVSVYICIGDDPWQEDVQHWGWVFFRRRMR